VDRIVVEDADPKTGFLVVPDLKWDGKDTKQLNLCVLINRRDLPTVRHLNADHLDLLENILHKSSKEIAAKYQIPVRKTSRSRAKL
jgi:m7GpppX diphosphatase